METLDAQFTDALTHINLNEAQVDKAKAAHKEVRDVLEADNALRSYGVDTILIGSYGRRVAIQPSHDVDIFVKLPAYTGNPGALYDALHKPLAEAYGDRLDISGAHAIAINFGSNFTIDAVGGRPSPHSAHWVIPGMDDRGNRNRWEETDPERLHFLTEERNKFPEVGGRGAYVPIVKMIRQIRRHHLGQERPKGLYLEMMIYQAFKNGARGGTFAELLAFSLDEIAKQFELGRIVEDPSLNKSYQIAPTALEVANAALKFRSLANQSASALSVDRCHAAVIWRSIFGKNTRGNVFPLPPNCDAEGNLIESVTSNPSLGSDEARGFARV